MTILTLTTDFGYQDYYLAAFKGLVLGKTSECTIVDISHNTPTFNMQAAAFNVKNCYPLYPEGTLHVVRVGESQMKSNRFLVCELNNHFFLLPDNGLITLISEKHPNKLIALVKDETSQTNAEFLSNIIGHIAKHKSIDELGNETTNFKELISQQPLISQYYIRGVVQHVDVYGNVITNITKELFLTQRKERPFELSTRAANFSKIATNYNQVPSGERLLIFNSAGFMQICIRQGNASELLGLRLSDIIQIDFYDS